MKHALILILIFLPQLILCQKVIIDPINETIRLDKQKTITVAKIITNEQRLAEELESIKAQFAQLNDSVQRVVVKYRQSIDRISQLTAQIGAMQDEINDLTNDQLKIEKKRRKSRLYGYGMIGFESQDVRTFDFGISWAREKLQFNFAIDPFLFEKPVFKAGIGFKIL